jgi:hypothetical protein
MLSFQDELSCGTCVGSAYHTSSGTSQLRILHLFSKTENMHTTLSGSNKMFGARLYVQYLICISVFVFVFLMRSFQEFSKHFEEHMAGR